MDFPKRIESLLHALNMNQTAFAKALGVSRGIISEFSSGAREPSKDFLFGISKLGISIDWFLTGEGLMFIDQKRHVSDLKTDTLPILENGHVSDLTPSPPPPNGLSSKIPTPIRIVKPSEVTGKHFLVPLLDQAVSAGRGADLPEADDVVSYIPAPSYLSRYGNDVAALKVRGDSMEPTLKDGDLVVCDTYGWQGDGIYVIRMDGEGFVKRLSRRPGRMVVHSDNTAYLPFEESIESQALNVVGKIRCAVRKME